MVEANRLQAGYCSSTQRAEWLRSYFSDAGIPADKLSVNDDTRPHAEHCSYVAVQEGRDTDLTRDEFSAFRSAANKLFHKSEDTRWATDEDKCLLVDYGLIDTMSQQEPPKDATEAGQNLDNPDDIVPITERYAVRDGKAANQDITYVFDREAGGCYAVDFNGMESSVVALAAQDGVKSADKRRQIIGAAIEAGPEVRGSPDQFGKLTVGDINVSGAGGHSPDMAEMNDGVQEDGTQTEDLDFVVDPGDTEYDHEQCVENVENWLSYKADDPTSDLIDGAWHTEFAQLNDENGNSRLGVYVRFDPWDGPLWDDSAGQFDTDDGSMPDEWSDHTAEMRSIFSSDDNPTDSVVDTDAGEYNDYYNYVPAADAASMG